MVKTIFVVVYSRELGVFYIYFSPGILFIEVRRMLYSILFIWFFCLSSLLSTVDSLVEMLSLYECYYHCQQWRDLNIHSRKCSFLHMQRWLVLAKLKYILVYLTGSRIDSLERFLTSTHNQHRAVTAGVIFVWNRWTIRHIIFDSFIEFLSVKSSILFTAFTLF